MGRLGGVVVSGAAGALDLGLQVGQALLEPQLELLLAGEVGVAAEQPQRPRPPQGRQPLEARVGAAVEDRPSALGEGPERRLVEGGEDDLG